MNVIQPIRGQESLYKLYNTQSRQVHIWNVYLFISVFFFFFFSEKLLFLLNYLNPMFPVKRCGQMCEFRSCQNLTRNFVHAPLPKEANHNKSHIMTGDIPQRYGSCNFVALQISCISISFWMTKFHFQLCTTLQFQYSEAIVLPYFWNIDVWYIDTQTSSKCSFIALLPYFWFTKVILQ